MLPFRRPSASAGAGNMSSGASSSRAHKSHESHHGFGQSHSLSSLGSLATPQQKIIQVLVNRLKNKMPCNSGTPLDRLEGNEATLEAIDALVNLSHDSLDIIAWSLTEQLERLAKTDSSGHFSIEVLQSQLFLLKVLSVAMASRYHQNPRSNSRTSTRPTGSAPESPVPGSSRRSRKTASDHSSSTPPPWSEPLALDDNCAKYILSVMVLFLRQTTPTDSPHASAARCGDISFSDYESLDPAGAAAALYNSNVEEPFGGMPDVLRRELRTRPSSTSVGSGKLSVTSTIPVPVGNTNYEKTHLSLVKSSYSINRLIAKFAGRIVFHISASNWKVVFNRLRTKIHYLANSSEENPDTVDLHVLSHSVLDRHRLVQVLNELSSLLVNMKSDAQLAIAGPVRTAVWNWIELFPAEFNEAIRLRGGMDGAPERVFDIFYANIQPGSEKVIWPTITALNCITTDRLPTDVAQVDMKLNRTGGKSARFSEELLKHMRSPSKLSEPATVCALDLCRAATYVYPEGEVPLRSIAFDVAHEIKSTLWMTPGKKPFWETTEDIDIALCAEAIVSTFRFLPEDDYLPLFSVCVEPERSEAVKTCALRACLTLVQEAPRFPWQKSLDPLEATLSPRLRSIWQTACVRRTEVDSFGNLKRIALRPKARKTTHQPLSDREVMLLGILSVWRAHPAFFLRNFNPEDINDWMKTSVKLWEAPVDSNVKISASATYRLIAEIAFLPSAPYEDQVVMITCTKSVIYTNLLSMATNLIQARTDVETQRLWSRAALHILEFFVKKTESETVREMQLSPLRVSGFVLAEIAFLVSLTSADMEVSNLAAQGLRLLSYAERQPGVPTNPVVSDEDRPKRHPVYEQLGDPRVMVVGRIGHQKRIRKLMRVISYSSAVHIAVWEECYWRWRTLNEFISENSSEAADDATIRRVTGGTYQEKRHQWQNLTLFLAALCGPCVHDNLDLNLLANVIPHRELPDEMRALQNPTPLVHAFVAQLTKMLMSEDIQLRDVARDALGAELSPRLYSRLLKHVEDIFRELALQEITEEHNFSMFADQFIAVIKLIVENANLRLEEVISIDISSTLLGFASFITRFDNPETLRVKIKFCLLCDSVCERSSTLTLRKDGLARHSILDIIVTWIVSSEHVPPEFMSTQGELNMSCLRTCVLLLDRLELKQLGDSTGDDSAHAVTRLFHRYSQVLLDGLEVCQLDIPTSDSVSEVGSIQLKMRASHREAELRELVITGLSYLVSTNTECGFKQCLPLAYSEDNRKRTIFAHVFARVIGQGTKFDPEDRSTSLAKQSRLKELVKQPDMTLVIAICETCPPAEVDGMISVLLNLFDTRASLMALIKLMIDRELARTENEASLFRGNTTCTRFLSAFAKIHGYNYLRSLVDPLIKSMETLPRGQGYEMDPSKAPGQDVTQNKKNVEFVAQSFLTIIDHSTHTLPSMFREICAHISKTVVEIWPDAKFPALGAFMFLRFISPAVVAPETVDIELPHESLRRGLMVIAKIIQNLANNIFFGKEAHMIGLNTFLQAHITDVTRFLSDINRYTPSENDENEWVGITTDDTDLIVLHRFFDKHADKIGKELLSISKPSTDGDTSAISGKRAWDGLCTLLVDLGAPLEVPKPSSLPSAEHPEYLNLMAQYNARSTESVRKIFVETEVPGPDTAVFVLRLSKIDVEAMDLQLLMFYIFKTLALPIYENRLFDLILDCTGFAAISEVPLRWLKYCAELIPSDIRSRFMTTHVLNPNFLTQKYLRRLYNVSAGTPFCAEIRASSSISELLESVHDGVLSALTEPMELEEEINDQFADVTMKTNATRLPVMLMIGVTHIRITSARPQAISPGLTCRSIEIIPLTDVGDVYNVSTTQDVVNEFIIRRNRTGSTVYFTSSSREVIVKCIRMAKGRLKDVQPPLAERFSRFSNVPATLLHVGLLSVDFNDEELRAAAYDLLGAVCTYLNYDKSPIVAAKAGFIPGDPSTFVMQLSERIADFAPQLTLDFISEVSAAMNTMEKSAITQVSQRLGCLQYLSPWIKNLAQFSNPTSPLYERSGARLRDCIRVLCGLSLTFPELTVPIQKAVWVEVGKLDTVIVDVVLDELVRSAVDAGIGSHKCETIAYVISSLSSISVRGRLISRLRKAVVKASPSLSKSLIDNPNWSEVSALIRLTLIAGYQAKQLLHNQLYVPEIIHVVTLVAGFGSTIVRKSVYGIVMNLLQSLYLARTEDSPASELQQLITDYTQTDTLKLFGLLRTTPTSEYTSFEPPNDSVNIDYQERLVDLLARMLEVTAGTRGLLNVWRARWMGLATASAFQYSSIIQMRSFTTLGGLASSDIDDDFVYQMLVAFKSALSQANETHTLAVVSMLRCISKIVPALPPNSRFLPRLFWIGIAFLQSSHIAFYVEATRLIGVTLTVMERRDLFKEAPVPTVLLDERSELEDVACQLDHILGLSFDASFSFSLASIIFKGLRHSGLKDSAATVLRALLKVTVQANEMDDTTTANGYKDYLCPDALGYFLALIPLSTTQEEYVRLLKDCNADEAWYPEATLGMEEENSVPRISPAFLGIHDASTALLASSFIGAMLASAQGDDTETEILYCLLSDIASIYPEIVAMTYDSIQDRIKDTFANSSNASIIRYMSDIIRTALQEAPRFGVVRAAGLSGSTLATVDDGSHGVSRNHLTALEELGMQGLANSFTFLPAHGGHATKMIQWISELAALVSL